MKIKFVYSVLPTVVFYNNVITKKFNRHGVAVGNLVFINKAYKNDEGLLQHELTHVKQFYKYMIIPFCILGYTNKYKLKFEVEAYKVQLGYCSKELKEYYLNKYAELIANTYGLPISKAEAILLLRK